MLRYGALALPTLATVVVGLLVEPAEARGAATLYEGWSRLLEPLDLTRGWRAAAAALCLLLLPLPAGLLAPLSARGTAGWFAAGAAGLLAATVLMPALEVTPAEAVVLGAGFAAGVVSRRAAARGQLIPVAAVLGTAVFILLLTLVPRDGSPALSPPRLSLIAGRRGGGDVLANIALFVPLGMALASVRLRLWQAIAAGALLSLGVETAQYWLPGRSPAAGDVVMNTLGAAAGWLLLYPTLSIWRRRREVTVLTLLASALPPAIIAATGWLLTPLVQDGEYVVRWVPARRGMDRWVGAITTVRLGEQALSPGLQEGAGARLQERLLQGEPLVIQGTTGPATARPASLLRVVVRWGEPRRARTMLAVIASRDDALLYLARRAAQHRLFEVYQRFPGAFATTAPGEPLRFEAQREGRRWCVRVNEVASCEVAFGVGDGWSLLVSSVRMPGGAYAFLSYLWVFLLGLPAGLAAPRRFRLALLHAFAMAVAIGVAVWLPGTLVLRPWEAALLMASYLAAATARAAWPRRPASHVAAQQLTSASVPQRTS